MKITSAKPILVLTFLFLSSASAHAEGSLTEFDAIKRIENKVGKERLDNYIHATYPVFFVSLCKKKQGENAKSDIELKQALVDHVKKEKESHPETDNLFGSDGGLDEKEKKSLVFYTMYLVQEGLKNKALQCEDIVEQMNLGLPRLR